MKKKRISNLIIIFVVTILITGCSTNSKDKASIKDTGNGTDITKLLEIAETESESLEEIPGETDGLGETEVLEDTQGLDEAQGLEETEGAGVEQNQEEEDSSVMIPSGDVDVDLTELSSSMVYAEVYNIVTRPEDYIGKTIRIQGLYYHSYYEATKKFYYYVVITDATACCQSGLEFIWIDHENGYPEDYPADETEVELTGVYKSYEELGVVYYYIATDEIVVK